MSVRGATAFGLAMLLGWVIAARAAETATPAAHIATHASHSTARKSPGPKRSTKSAQTKLGTAPATPAAPSASAPRDSSAAPSFAGRWKLSMTRSSFGVIPGGKPTSRTDLIEQDGIHIKQTLYLVLGSKPDTTVYRYTTDGVPTVNKVASQNIRSVVTWERRTLHLVSAAKLLVLDTSLDDRWTLAPNGRELVYQRHVNFGFGSGDQTLVFERE